MESLAPEKRPALAGRSHTPPPPDAVCVPQRSASSVPRSFSWTVVPNSSWTLGFECLWRQHLKCTSVDPLYWELAPPSAASFYSIILCFVSEG